MAIDPTQPIPIYFQLKTLLLEEILKGRYGADGRLPTEHELCERFGISRHAGQPRAVRARRRGRDPPAPPARHVRQPARAPATAGPTRGARRRVAKASGAR